MSAAPEMSVEDPIKTAHVGEVLRAAELARKWLATPEGMRMPAVIAHRCFVLGYLAACKDRT